MKAHPAAREATSNARRRGQLHALLATLMHCDREYASATESATHCLRYLPKDPRLRSTGRPQDPRTPGITTIRRTDIAFATIATTTAARAASSSSRLNKRSNNCSSSSSSSGSRDSKLSRNTHTSVKLLRARAICASAKKNIRSNIRSIGDDASTWPVSFASIVAKWEEEEQKKEQAGVSSSGTLTRLSGQLFGRVV
ncbi:uncharacterized protein LOC120895846 [Anopheles arabiensis]|uniref:uncharacterized protein LOC120895846 n=1 Tax=Anopheles arabiensis TaxID=7173 RepID=UPI001AACFAEE|nr:uncharacterized protein LOC120895846 [Anopheles arabiensis]XP_040155457.1 uncharacterized protein LOC120895846 [Anopheles arabiensis]XP_040155458.1 uncharacterized protein LOC120895846 [Anopheles arabiensis]